MSLRANDLYSTREQQSPALSASMRMNSFGGMGDYGRTGIPGENDIEHLELRQDLVDRESILALQQQRNRLHEVEDLVRQKENEAEMARLEAMKGSARVDALEGALARTSARKTMLEKELAERIDAVERERRMAELANRQKDELAHSISAYKRRCEDAEALASSYDARINDLNARNGSLERRCAELEGQTRVITALRTQLADAERDSTEMRARLAQMEQQNSSLRREIDALQGELAFERSKRAEMADKLSAVDKLAAARANEAYRLEQEIRAKEALLHVKQSELESSKRLQDALARENYETRLRRDDAERQIQMTRADLERERAERAERARSRLGVLERRSLEEEMVSNNVDNLVTMSQGGSFGRSMSMTGTSRGAINTIASPLAVTRASERMSKNQIRDLITSIDRSLVN